LAASVAANLVLFAGPAAAESVISCAPVPRVVTWLQSAPCCRLWCRSGRGRRQRWRLPGTALSWQAWAALRAAGGMAACCVWRH